MALSLSQLEQDDLQAGWPASLVPQAAAVEEAESSADPSAIGPGGSWGLFQIQPQYHPDIAKTSNPVAQSKAGLQVYQSQGWGAWSTYGGATYEEWLPKAQAAAGQQGSQPNSSASASPGSCDTTTGTWTDAQCGPLDPACALENFTGAIMCKIGYVGRELGFGAAVVLGLAVVFAGLWFLIRDTALGQAIKASLKKGAQDVKKGAKVAAAAA